MMDERFCLAGWVPGNDPRIVHYEQMVKAQEEESDPKAKEGESPVKTLCGGFMTDLPDQQDAKKRKRGGQRRLKTRKKYDKNAATGDKLLLFLQMMEEAKEAGTDLAEADRQWVSKYPTKIMRCYHGCCGSSVEVFTLRYPSLTVTKWKCVCKALCGQNAN